MAASLRGASRASLVKLREQIDEVVGDADAATVSDELFSVVDLLDQQPALRRALTDPARSGADRRALAEALLSGKVSPAATEVTARATALGWARTRDLSDSIETAAVLVAVTDADRRGRLDSVEDQLFAFGGAVDESPSLASALSDPVAPTDAKVSLVGDLLDGADAVTVSLAKRAVQAPRAGTLSETVGDFARIAADLRRRLVATVRTAVELNDGQRDRLRSALGRQYGREIHLNVVVEPEVVGGMSVTVGDDLIDGTLRTRVTEAARLIAG
jgi:F-type H+-transporting ATPase subunit delta